MTVKLTKTELRNQQNRLLQFQKYLPTLQMKKTMLQFEVTLVEMEIAKFRGEAEEKRRAVEDFCPFFVDKTSFDLAQCAEILRVHKHYENIAGVEIPTLDSVVFKEASYLLFYTPVWAESAVELVRELVIARTKFHVAEEKKRALEKELKEVSIRVNLFEKILIPRSRDNINKIKIFLGDQFLAAVGQAKVAKKKNDRRSA